MLNERTPYSVLSVSSSQSFSENLCAILPISSFSPICHATSCGEAKRMLVCNSYDIIIINTPLSDEFGTEFALNCANDSNASIILMVKSELFDEVSYKVEEYGIMTIAKPTSKSILYPTFKLAAATHERFKILEKKNENIMAKMEEIRVVNRAKWVLIKYLNMSEERAHRYIEKRAMDMRLPKREVAESIIKTYET